MENLHFPLLDLSSQGGSRAQLYQALDQCRAQLGLNPEQPVDPYRLAARFGCQVAAHYFNSTKIAGMLLRNPNQTDSPSGVILLNGLFSSSSLRFTLAHELVHLMLHPTVAQSVCIEELSSQKSRLEWEANEGAAELLLPYRQVLPYFSTLTGLSFFQKAERISARFQVSPTTARYRLEELKGDWEDYISGTALSDLPLLSRRERKKFLEKAPK